MQFTTPVRLPSFLPLIDYSSQYLAIGSCFAETMAEKMRERKIDVEINPLGTLFNPASIALLISRALESRYFSEDDFFDQDGQWISFDLHSDISSFSASSAAQRANDALRTCRDRIAHSKAIILTFGSAYIYRLKSSNHIVSNCHHEPQTSFTRERLEPYDITETYCHLIQSIRLANPAVKIILTVSPVRHLRDGIHENQVSKSILHLAVDEIVYRCADCCTYFPSYEIMIDELRDYRFYADDMTHISAAAEQYIFEAMSKTYIAEDTRQTMSDIERLMQTIHHRPRLPQSDESQTTARLLLNRIEQIKSKATMADFSTEIAELQSRLSLR